MGLSSGSQAPAWEPVLGQSFAWLKGQKCRRDFPVARPSLAAKCVHKQKLGDEDKKLVLAGGTGFQPVTRTGKIPVPPKTFRDRISVG